MEKCKFSHVLVGSRKFRVSAELRSHVRGILNRTVIAQCGRSHARDYASNGSA
jgi:hypothetical protein